MKENGSARLWKFLLLCAAWALPVILFVLAHESTLLTYSLWLAFAITIILTVFDRAFLVLGLPFVAMLSPLAETSRLAGLFPSELYIIYTSLYLFTNARIGGLFTANRSEHLLVLLMAIVAVSYMLSGEYNALFTSLVNWAAIVVVFMATKSILTSLNLIAYLFYTFVAVSVCVSIIIIVAYENGMVLANYMVGLDEIVQDRDILQYKFRASYYYTNIFFIVGAASIMALIGFIYDRRILSKAVYSAAIIILVYATFLLQNKTGYVALIFTLVSALLIRYFKKLSPIYIINASVYILVVVSLIALSTEYNFFNVFGSAGLDITSFVLRLDVVDSTISVMLQAPERIWFGFGPDVTIRVDNLITNLARSSGSGFEGAIDSSYVTFLFEYGVIFMLIFIAYGYSNFVSLYHIYTKHLEGERYIYSIILLTIFIYVAAISQVIGTSKVAWLIVQIFAVSSVVLKISTKSLSLVRRGQQCL